MPSVTAPATSSLLHRLKTSYASGAAMSLAQIKQPGGQSDVTPEIISEEVAPLSDPARNTNPAAAVSADQLPNTAVEEQLAILDQVLTQVETQAVQAMEQTVPPTMPSANQVEPVAVDSLTVPAQAIPLAVSQMADTNLNPTHPVGGSASAKERFDSGSTPDISAIDTGANVQVVEVETTPELPVEVEGFLQHVEDHQAQLPTEVVITTDAVQPFIPPRPLTPVVVLPITPEIEAAGSKKNAHWSVRWLVEWSRKVMKMFNGSVIYAQSNQK